nr:vegetative cell wall protein gp1-like [Camelus dromedarius]
MEARRAGAAPRRGAAGPVRSAGRPRPRKALAPRPRRLPRRPPASPRRCRPASLSPPSPRPGGGAAPARLRREGRAVPPHQSPHVARPSPASLPPPPRGSQSAASPALPAPPPPWEATPKKAPVQVADVWTELNCWTPSWSGESENRLLVMESAQDPVCQEREILFLM